jgi:hypothetical protein
MLSSEKGIIICEKRNKRRIIYHQFVEFNLLAKASNDERKVYTIKDFQNDDIGKTKMKKKSVDDERWSNSIEHTYIHMAHRR